MDPEELFRTIFGDFGKASNRAGGFRMDDMGAYEESNFGFGSTQEVSKHTCQVIFAICFTEYSKMYHLVSR